MRLAAIRRAPLTWCSHQRRPWACISAVLTPQPGDVIALATPGGVGHTRKPPRYLGPGQVLTTRIAGLGSCRNTCVAEKTP
jgi:acylpyruvate hydrolase